MIDLRTGITIAVTLALVWAGYSYVQGEREEVRVQVQGEYMVQLAEAKAEALATERELTSQRDNAIKGRDEREKANRTLAAAATTASNSLRDTLASIRNGLSSDSDETVRNRADTLAVLLGECTREYRSLGESADRHANDVQTFDQAWPVVKTPTTKQE